MREGKKSPLGKITQDDDITKSACTEQKSVCAGDGTETGEGICFNATVMAADSFTPAAGFLLTFFALQSFK